MKDRNTLVRNAAIAVTDAVINPRMIFFDKISLKQYLSDRMPALLTSGLSEEEGCRKAEEEYSSIQLPRRATARSAGYDLRVPFDLTVHPGESVVIPTGLRVCMEDDMWLGIYIRSSLGFKYGVRLKNSVAVIDADYYGADNEGHLKVGIYHHGDRDLILKAGDAFAQGIFQRYILADNDDPVQERRTGGFGSTNHR